MNTKHTCIAAMIAILAPFTALAQQPQPNAQQLAAQRTLNAMNQYAIAVAIDDKCDFLLSFERITAEAAVSTLHQQLVRAGAKPSELEQHKQAAIGQISDSDCTTLGQTNGVLSLKQEIQRNTGGMLKRFEESPWYICDSAVKAMVYGSDAEPKQERIKSYIGSYLASLSDVPNWAAVSEQASKIMTITFPDSDPACKAMLNIHALAELQQRSPDIHSVKEFTLAKSYRGQHPAAKLDFAVMENAKDRSSDRPFGVRYGFLRDGRFAFDFRSGATGNVPEIYDVLIYPEATGGELNLGQRAPELEQDGQRRVFVLTLEETRQLLGASYRKGELYGIEFGIEREQTVDGSGQRNLIKFNKRSMAHNLVNALSYATAPAIDPKQ